MQNTPTNIIDDLRLLQEPLPLWVVLALAASALTALLFGAWWWRRARRRSASQPCHTVAREAMEDALAELERLRQQIAAANSRAYAIAVSGVIRRYLERRFGIQAPCRSTEEFLREAKTSSALAPEYQSLLGNFLAGCDFLKFARGLAEVPELEAMHTAAVKFVAETQPAPAAGPKT